MSSVLRSKAFLSLFFQNFCILASLNVLNVLPDHLAAIGASKTYIGFYMNISSLMLVVLSVFLSDHADRFGRKRLILLGYALSFTAYSLSFFWPDHLVMLAILRALSSLIFCLAFTVQTAEMFGLLPRERRFFGMAIYGISGLLANPIGTFLGETLNGAFGARWLFAAAAAFTAAGFISAAGHRFHEESGPDAKRAAFSVLFKRTELMPLFIFAFMVGGAWSVFATFLANLTRERIGVPAITGFFASFSVVAIFIRLFLGSRLEKISPRLIIAVCFPLETIGFLLAYTLHDAWMLPVIGVIFGTGHSIMYPLVSALFVNSGHDADRLGLNNLFSFLNQGGGIVAAVAMGAFADAAGLPIVFLTTGLICLAMVPLSLWGLPLRTPSPSPCPKGPAARL